MQKRFFLFASLIAAFSLMCAMSVPIAHAAGAKARAAASKAEAKPAGELVEYADLENRVGQTVSIETTYDTTRTGKLIKYTNPALALQLGPEHGSIELTVARDTVRSIRVVTSAPAAQPGAGSAEKN